MVKKKKKIELSEDNQVFRSLKCPLKSVLVDGNTIVKINEITDKINIVRTHMLHFTKLYFIYLFDNGLPFPLIDRQFFNCIVRIISIGKNTKPFTKNLDLNNTLKKFNVDYYQPLMYKNELIIDITGLKDTIDYMLNDCLTDFENNIKMRFYDHLKKFIDSMTNKKDYINFIRTKEKDNEIKKSLCKNKYKNVSKMLKELCEFNNDQTYIYSSWINEQKTNIFPQRKIKENSYFYDLKCNPQDYLRGMFYMANKCESNGHSFLNVFPLKRSIIQGHIRIDTKGLSDNFLDKADKLKQGKGMIEEMKELVWSKIFRTNKEIFNSKKFKFNGSIQTDGVSVTILQKHITNEEKKSKKNKINEFYIDELEVEEVDSLRDLKIISIDPNKGDLIHCSTGTRNSFESFRYTQNQRNKETGKKKQRKILEFEKSLISEVKILESELSACNSKTNNLDLFTNYILIKNKVNYELREFYSRTVWRKARLSSYVKTQKSENNLIKNFKEKFGSPDKSFIGFGDWMQKKQMKYQEPTKGKGFRILLRKAGYKVYLVDEYKTSKKCSCCKTYDEDSDCDKFKKQMSSRPWRRKKEELCHGLVKCKTCNTVFNRDVNSTLNIREIVKSVLCRRVRPIYLNRKLQPD